ncbi:MAG: phosphoribosylglycinamide formyltransferase [Bacteroidales bacterium]|jgi:phosphoribosylglycinamide formyltransferase-1|nr:phosphoribosylglycinamide formyltransferase [Bacteroidales bacterium]
MRNIAIFASGSGTNAENIIRYFSNEKAARVALVLSNKREAYVLKRAEALETDSIFFDRDDLYKTGRVLEYLENYRIDFIVLAGFLWLIPDPILGRYVSRIVNIHPALLPKYGGKGMYGDRVHKTVLENRETESGITIHYVNRNYDEGDIIFQARCAIAADDTPASLAEKVHALEYSNYPVVVKELIQKLP